MSPRHRSESLPIYQPLDHNVPSCTRHPRWITMGCIIFSLMLSCSLLTTKSWHRSLKALDIEREWQWPDMDPYAVIAASQSDDELERKDPALTEHSSGQGHDSIGAKPKTWDMDDPALQLGTFLASPAWTEQSMLPGHDLVNLLSTLRPVDHAFFITLFLNQAPRPYSPEETKGTSPKVPGSSAEAAAAAAMAVAAGKDHRVCGPWIQDYVEFQNRILDKTLPARYTIHSCAHAVMAQQQQHVSPQNPASTSSSTSLAMAPCGDLFSQMIAMTSAFAWSITESRGFFLRQDQVQGLGQSFDSALFQLWTAPPPKADTFARVNTEDMSTRDVDRLFQLEDPLFSSHVPLESKVDNRVFLKIRRRVSAHLERGVQIEGDGQGFSTAAEKHGGAAVSGSSASAEQKNNGATLQDEQWADEQTMAKLWALRSKSRNRVSFERMLAAQDAVPSTAAAQELLRGRIQQGRAGRGQQSRLGQHVEPEKMKKLQSGLEQDGVELVLNRDLLPQFVNTTRALEQMLDLDLPLPERVIQENQSRRDQSRGTSSSSNHDFVRGGVPSFHHGPLSPGSSDSHSQERFLSAAFHDAIHDGRDVSRTRAVPKTFGCLLDILIQPQVHLQHMIHPYATLFQLPAVFSIGIYIQPSQLFDPATSTEISSPSSSGAGGRVSSWKALSDQRNHIVDRYLTCARQIAREFAPKRKGQKVIYVVVSKDPGMARVMESQEEWDEEVITPKWRAPKPETHAEETHEATGQQKEVSDQDRAVLESWVLSKTDFQVVSDHSDFAKVAVWRTRKEGRSVVIREEEGGVMEGEAFVDMLDCGTLLENLNVAE